MTTGHPQGGRKDPFHALVEQARPLRLLTDQGWLAGRNLGGDGPPLYRVFGPEGLIHRAVRRGGVLSGINTTQMRKLFAEVQHVVDLAERGESGWRRVLEVKLPPLLAYAYGRGHLGSRQAYQLLRDLLSPIRVQDKEDARTLGEVFQAILGYAKMEGR